MSIIHSMRAGALAAALIVSVFAQADNCGRVSGQNYWTCRAIAQRSCGLAVSNSEGYQLCQGVTRNNCVLAGAKALTCQAITTKSCSMAIGEDYWLCVALTR
ncbi:MAG: hypothetical protein IT288_00605 [Bdellovibrionales bacterium]|nr:hypothetical protein [Bdellovibrionales bacterium]